MLAHRWPWERFEHPIAAAPLSRTRQRGSLTGRVAVRSSSGPTAPAPAGRPGPPENKRGRGGWGCGDGAVGAERLHRRGAMTSNESPRAVDPSGRKTKTGYSDSAVTR